MAKSKKDELVKTNRVLAFLLVVVALGFGYSFGKLNGWFVESVSKQELVREERVYVGELVELPQPRLSGGMSLEAALQARRSIRSFSDQALTMQQVSQVLWSMQGLTSDWGGRTTPSAHSAYPLELTVVVKNVNGLEPGIYHYIPGENALGMISMGVPDNFDEAAVQAAGKGSPVVFYVSGDFAKMAEAFEGESHDENVYLEAGHAGQNVYLQVESLGLGTVVMGGFNPVLMHEVLDLPSQEVLIYQIPVGYSEEE